MDVKENSGPYIKNLAKIKYWSVTCMGSDCDHGFHTLHPAHCCQTDVGMTTQYAHQLQTHMAIFPFFSCVAMHACIAANVWHLVTNKLQHSQ